MRALPSHVPFDEPRSRRRKPSAVAVMLKWWRETVGSVRTRSFASAVPAETSVVFAWTEARVWALDHGERKALDANLPPRGLKDHGAVGRHGGDAITAARAADARWRL
ncbi:MAG: hypothetical protein R3F14_36270 [Polyangiaceae bacterium]